MTGISPFPPSEMRYLLISMATNHTTNPEDRLLRDMAQLALHPDWRDYGPAGLAELVPWLTFLYFDTAPGDANVTPAGLPEWVACFLDSL